MGYHTEFRGKFDLDKPLTPAQIAYLKAFNQTRRVRRDAAKTALRPDPIREAVGLAVGPEGCFFVAETGFMGSDDGPDVTDGNESPRSQPNLWCQWEPTDDGKHIEWDSGEKFYNYVQWLEYLIEKFLKPWGYVLNGTVGFRGEEWGDEGSITVVNNKVTR